MSTCQLPGQPLCSNRPCPAILQADPAAWWVKLWGRSGTSCRTQGTKPGGEAGGLGENGHVYVWLSPFAVHL